MMSKTHRLFVYGTLMRGFHNHRFLDGAAYLGEAYLPGYCMFSLGGFPGILPKYDHRVHGELHEITEDMLPSLDRLEGVPRLYTRETKEVFLDHESLDEAFVYVYAGTSGRTQLIDIIESGRWEG